MLPPSASTATMRDTPKFSPISWRSPRMEQAIRSTLIQSHQDMRRLGSPDDITGFIAPLLMSTTTRTDALPAIGLRYEILLPSGDSATPSNASRAPNLTARSA